MSSRKFWSFIKDQKGPLPVENSPKVFSAFVANQNKSENGDIPSRAPRVSFVEKRGVRKRCIKNESKIRKRKRIENVETDRNISHIHNSVLDALRNPTFFENPGAYSDIKKNLKQLERLSRKSVSFSTRIDSVTRLTQMRSLLRDVEEGLALGWYLLKCHPYLSQIRNSRVAKVFIQQNVPAEKDVMSRESALISVACEFISVPNFSSMRGSCRCKGGELVKEESGVVCTVCGTFNELFLRKSSFCDASKSTGKNTAPKNVHFADVVRNHQGKQNITNVDEFNIMLNVVKKEMEYNSISIEQLKKSHIYRFLSENKYGNYYNDINLIHHRITGEKCPDLSSIEKELFEYHEKYETAYAEIKRRYTDRVSSLNVYFKLYKLLQLLDFPCRKEDFFLLKTQAKYNEHRAMHQLICERNGWKYIDK